ncbi:MAG TPA: hypothetical protein VHM25_03085 [Polyangiaceae bacterium]|jgi:predicted anti-sigma-YlaC factor YlaD|nr:hypothetical protein [Polyangiaceae bacterium]
MDCSQVRDSFMSGDRLSDEQLEAHLAQCPQCQALFERDAELGRRLAVQANSALAFPDDLFAQVEQGLARETGPRAWLRSRPSRARFVFTLLPVLLAVVAGGLLRQRADFAQYPLLRVVLLLCVYFVAIALAFAKELSELPRQNPLRESLPLLAFALAVPILAAFAPATELSAHASAEGALNCFGYGALFTLPVALLLWAFDRNDRPSLRTVFLSAAALGLSANLLLELHCSNGNPLHVLLGHASLGVAWLVVWAAVRGLSRAESLSR